MRLRYNLRLSLIGALKSVTMWVNGLFLAAYPFATEIIAGLHDAMPTLAEYLPSNVYKGVGLAVVVFNLYQRTRTVKSLKEKGEQ